MNWVYILTYFIVALSCLGIGGSIGYLLAVKKHSKSVDVDSPILVCTKCNSQNIAPIPGQPSKRLCNDCWSVFDLFGYMAPTPPPIVKKGFECKYCGDSVNTEKGLKLHIVNKHLNEIN